VLCSFLPRPWLMAMVFIVGHLSRIFIITISIAAIGLGHYLL